jgi:hypothetical protein
MNLKMAGWVSGAVALAVVALATDEITSTAFLKLANGKVELQRSTGNSTFTQNGVGFSYHVQVVGTASHEAITVSSDVTTNGWAWFRNVTTNADRYVEIGVDAAGTFLQVHRLYAGEYAQGPVHPTNTLYAKAFVGDVNLECWFIQR